VHFARSRPTLALLSAVALVAIVVPLLASGSGHAETRENTREIRITERDFSISAAAKTLNPGTVTLRVRNNGPDSHELIVTRADDKRLPLRRDGLTVNEERLQPRIAGGLEPGAPGSVRTLRVHLTPGRYVLFCNMAGHYLGGMHATLVVR
jgi:uncharacterized cupredoxin-like copper-binding protein